MYRQHEEIAGTLPLQEMPYLRDSQNRQSGEASAQLRVFLREDGKVVLAGKAQADLNFTCQRCLQPFDDTVKTDFELVLVKQERELHSVEDKDDALVVDDKLAVYPVIEQELILALPMIPKHPDCTQQTVTPDDDNTSERQQPFANLKDLFNKTDPR